MLLIDLNKIKLIKLIKKHSKRNIINIECEYVLDKAVNLSVVYPAMQTNINNLQIQLTMVHSNVTDKVQQMQFSRKSQ